MLRGKCPALNLRLSQKSIRFPICGLCRQSLKMAMNAFGFVINALRLKDAYYIVFVWC